MADIGRQCWDCASSCCSIPVWVPLWHSWKEVDDSLILLLWWMGFVWICCCCTVVYSLLGCWVHIWIVLRTIRWQPFGHGLYNERINWKSPLAQTYGSLCWLIIVNTGPLFFLEKSRSTTILGYNGRNLHLVLHSLPLHHQRSTKLENNQKGEEATPHKSLGIDSPDVQNDHKETKFDDSMDAADLLLRPTCSPRTLHLHLA